MAFAFDGLTNYIDCGDNLDFGTGVAFTAMAWVKRSATGVRHEILSKEPQAGGTGWELSIQVWDGAEFGNFNGSFPVVQSTTTLASNTLHHVCGVYDTTAALLRMYIDGVQEATTATGATGSVNTQSLVIGNGPWPLRVFNGLMEDVRVYNRALTADEVQTIYASRGRDRIVSGLVGRWVMNEGAPNTGGATVFNVQTASSIVAGSSLTLAYTVPSTVDSAVLVVCGGAESVPSPIGNAVLTTVMFGASGMTLRASSNTTTTAGCSTGIFTLAVAPGDSGTITVNYTGSCESRTLIAFVVTGALATVNTSGFTFNNVGNATTGFTTSAADKLGIIFQQTGDINAKTGVSGAAAVGIGEVITAGTGTGCRVLIFVAAAATTYSGYGFTFGAGPSRSSISGIALNLNSITVPDLSGGGITGTVLGPIYAENIVVDNVG
jgi:hypothetical protein